MNRNIMSRYEYTYYTIKKEQYCTVEKEKIKMRLKEHFSMHYKTTKVLHKQIYAVEMFEIGDNKNSIDRKIFELYKIRELEPIANIEDNDNFDKKLEMYITNKCTKVTIQNWSEVELFAMKNKISFIEAKVIALWCLKYKKDNRVIGKEEWRENFRDEFMEWVAKVGGEQAAFNSNKKEEILNNKIIELYHYLDRSKY